MSDKDSNKSPHQTNNEHTKPLDGYTNLKPDLQSTYETCIFAKRCVENCPDFTPYYCIDCEEFCPRAGGG